MDKKLAVSRVAPLLLVMVSIGCEATSLPRLSSDQEAAISEALLSTTAEYNASWEALDFEQIARFHAADFTY